MTETQLKPTLAKRDFNCSCTLEMRGGLGLGVTLSLSVDFLYFLLPQVGFLHTVGPWLLAALDSHIPDLSLKRNGLLS